MAEQGPYNPGDVAVLEAVFTDALTEAPVNPSAVVFRVLRPSGALDTVSGVLNPEVGLFRGEYEFVEPGDHWWSAEGTAGAKAYEHARLPVAARRT